MTAVLAPQFDHFICYELEKFRRGKSSGEIANLLQTGLMKAGVPQDRIDLAQGYEEATRQLSQIAGKGDLLVVLMDDIHEYLPVFRENFSSHRKNRNRIRSATQEYVVRDEKWELNDDPT